MVTRLEQAIAGTGIEIKSPDRIPDRDTGEPREVDVALRVKAGSVTLLAIIECRDRGRTQDTRWIEELVSKARSVSAHKVVAVSSNGFTSNAITKARVLGVDLRTVAGLDAAAVRQWFPFEMLALTQRSLRVVGWLLTPTDLTIDNSWVKSIKENDAALRTGGSSEQFSLAAFFTSMKPLAHAAVNQQFPIGRDLPRPGDAIRWEAHPPFKVGIRLRAPGLECAVDGQRCPVDAITAVVEVTTALQVLRYEQGQSYRAAEGEPLAARFPLSADVQQLLTKQVELIVLPDTKRFTLSTVEDDGTGRVLLSGNIPTLETELPSTFHHRPSGTDNDIPF